MLELDQGFAFVGRQVRLDVGGDEFHCDLLFYHLPLRAFVVVELKATDFDPGFIYDKPLTSANVVVLRGQLTNSASSLKAAIKAYHQLLPLAVGQGRPPQPIVQVTERGIVVSELKQLQHRFTEIELDEAEQLYNLGATLRAVSMQIGGNRIQLGRQLKARAVQLRRQGLSPEQIDESVELYESGQSLAVIGRRFDVDAMTVRARLLEQGVVTRDCQGRTR